MLQAEIAEHVAQTCRRHGRRLNGGIAKKSGPKRSLVKIGLAASETDCLQGVEALNGKNGLESSLLQLLNDCVQSNDVAMAGTKFPGK